MKMKTFLKILIFAGIGFALIYFLSPLVIVREERTVEPETSQEETMAGLSNDAVDLIGSKTGTSTDPYSFENTAATTSEIVLIHDTIDTATLNVYAPTASSSAQVNITIQQSNDSGCNTTNTTDGSAIKMSEIDWFDYEKKSATSGSTETYQTGTTTYAWVPGGDERTGWSKTLTNLNSRCLKVSIGSASTTIWATLKTKLLFQ